ncbi:MAG: YqeG family HAD IIIA-type phosphatase [Clostridiaceae bacterium]
MIEKFYPSYAVDSITDITAEILDANGIKGLILDIDNTLVPNHVADADDRAVNWIEGIKAGGFKVCIVSNASRKRVVQFNDRLKLYAVHRALKPGSRAFNKAGRMMDFKNKNIAVIGDQIFTDIFGGNRIGMFTILVKPIDLREGRIVRFKRILEKKILKKYAKRQK